MAYIKEILESANRDINTLKQHIGNKYLRNLMEAAYLPDKKMLLPEGVPPYKENTLHESQTSGQFWQLARKMEVFHREDVKSILRERAFIGALEGISKEEARILIAVKDQTLDKLYPNLTYQNLISIGYFVG